MYRGWCRLCAEENSPIEIFTKKEDGCDIAELIRKYLQLNIGPLDQAPVTLCNPCLEFLLSVDRFAERAIKVDEMYSSIVFDQINSMDLSMIKCQFGLVKEEPTHSTYLPKCDQSTDTFDLTIEFLPTSEYASNDLTNTDETDVAYKNEDDNNTNPSTEDKFDPLVQKYITLKKEDVEPLEDMCVTYMENDNGSSDIEEDNDQEEVDSKEMPKKKGRKRKGPPYPCNKCNETFLDRNSLHYHKKHVHLSPAKKLFPCGECDKKFPTRRRAEQHAMVHLDPDQRPAHPCPHCDKQFTKSTNLRTHIKTIHVGERPFICEACGKSFATNGALKEHRYTHKEDTPFKCSKCDKTFKTQQRLKTHEDIHIGTMYVCPSCGLILNTKRTLQMHMVVHSDQKKHKCTICSSEFKRAKALKNHLILHSGLRPYTCPFCDKTFANGSNCRSHKKKAHPVELAAMEAAGESCRPTNIPKLEQLRSS